MRLVCLSLVAAIACSSQSGTPAPVSISIGGAGSAGNAEMVGAGGIAGGGSGGIAGGAGMIGGAGAATAGSGGSGVGGGSGGSSIAGAGGSVAGVPPRKQVLIWIWMNYKTDLQTVLGHAESFTDVSPALYQMNYAYTGGTPKLVNENDNFDGISSSEICRQTRAAGLRCIPLIYAGGSNQGTDQGIQNVLNDSPSGTQGALISSMVAEAKAKGYDGYNLDWEVNNTGYAQYGSKLVSFLSKFKKSLNAEGMLLSIDVAGFYTHQCGGDGLMDLTQLGSSVDLAIMEDYATTLGSPGASCPASKPVEPDCYKDFTGLLQVMCNLPPQVVSVGGIAPDTSSFATEAFQAVSNYGFIGVALWPGNQAFLGRDHFADNQSWYSVFSAFLASK